MCFFYFIVRDRPKLESRLEERVRAVIGYASTVYNFNDLVDPWTLACHYLRPEPSHYVFRAIHRKEKMSHFRMKIDCLSFLFFSPFPFLLSFLTLLLFLFSFAKMTTKFNQEFYARIKPKKNKPLSSIG